jgi:hypothetical protein
MTKAVAGYLVTAAILAGAAGVVLMAGRLEGRIADADLHLASLNLVTAGRLYDDVSSDLARLELVPGPWRQPRRQVDASRAAIRYWRGDYAELATEFPDVSASEVRDNPALQIIVANAVHRMGREAAGEIRELVMNGLDRSIAVYQQVLHTQPGDLDAAFNYEYLVRLRRALFQGDQLPPNRPEDLFGREGDQPDEMSDDEMDDTQVYVPLSWDERRENDDDPTIGEGSPIQKRG